MHTFSPLRSRNESQCSFDYSALLKMPSVESLKMSADQPKPLAYDAYQDLAEHYAAHIETKPHNAYYTVQQWSRCGRSWKVGEF